jgi:hypothetical protein
MKKYIFTENQIKKIIDSQLNEEMSMPAVSKASGTIRKAGTIQSDIDIIKKLKTKTVKLVILGFRSDVSNSDVYNKNYKQPTVVGSIAGIPLDAKAQGKQFDNDTMITLNNGATLYFGVVGAEPHLAIANGGLSIKNDNGKMMLDFAWD